MRDLAITGQPVSAMMPPRAKGRAQVDARARAGVNVIDRLHQSGASRVLFPLSDDPGLQAVLLNTAGGMTGGDVFDIGASAATGARLTLTTQAAERIYRCRGGPAAQMTTRLAIAPSARLDWLPQETILFNHAQLRRELTVDMAADAVFLGVETLVFGRQLMGELVTHLNLHDRVKIFRDGTLAFQDCTRIAGDAAAQLAGPSTACGLMAVANVVFAAPEVTQSLAQVRALMPAHGGASIIRPGLLFARLVAADSFELRRALIPVLAALRGASLPRTWTM